MQHQAKTVETGNLEIRALNIKSWSEKHESRAKLAVLVRKLINNTGTNLTKVDFPAYENSELPGWDGEVESESATQKIPLGKSRWELGVSKDPKAKGNWYNYVAVQNFTRFAK